MSQLVGNAGKFELSALMRRYGGPLTNILEPAVAKDLLVPVRFRFPDDSISQISSVGTDSETVTETEDDVSLPSTESLDRRITKPQRNELLKSQKRLERNRTDQREADDSDEDIYRTQKPKVVEARARNMRARPSSATSSSSRSSSRLDAPVRRQAAVDREEKQMLHRLFTERKTPDLTSKKPPRQTGDQSRRPASVDYSNNRHSANGDHRHSSSEQNVRQLPRRVNRNFDNSARNSAFDDPNRGRQRDVIDDERDEKSRFCQSYCSERRHSGSGFGKHDSQARLSSAKRTQRRDSVESDVPRRRRSSVESAPLRQFRESTLYDQRRHRSDSIDTNGSHADRKRSQRTSEDVKLQELALLEHLVQLLSEDS